jgi:hypothetical protein
MVKVLLVLLDEIRKEGGAVGSFPGLGLVKKPFF